MIRLFQAAIYVVLPLLLAATVLVVGLVSPGPHRSSDALAAAVLGDEQLATAAGAGDARTVYRLIHCGAPLAYRSPISGFDAVMSATAAGQIDILRALLDAGAPADQRTSRGHSSLMFAASQSDEASYMPMIDLLLGRGADPNARANCGSTPLDAAAFAGRPDVVYRLLAAGADPTAAALLDDSRDTVADDSAEMRECRVIISRAAARRFPPRQYTFFHASKNTALDRRE